MCLAKKKEFYPSEMENFCYLKNFLQISPNNDILETDITGEKIEIFNFDRLKQYIYYFIWRANNIVYYCFVYLFCPASEK